MTLPSKPEQQSFTQRWVLVIVCVFFALSLAAYLSKFHGGLSDDQDTWGQFGDFMGGAINPIIGLCTVWLLTVSLRQNQLALHMAHDELRLATKALEESSAMQAKTEAALKQQVEIADQTRDMANAAALCNHFYVKKAQIKEHIRALSNSNLLTATVRDKSESQLQTIGGLAGQLERILEKEARRLLERYSDQPPKAN